MQVIAQFRDLAPARRPISLQTWGPRRVILALGVVLITALALTNTYQLFTPVELPIDDKPSCGINNVMILMAQSVPSATSVPCVASLPAGWSVGGARISRGEGQFWLNSDQAGKHALDVTLRPENECNISGATEVASDEPGLRRYELPSQLPPNLRAVRMYVTNGECVTYRFQFSGDSNASAIVVLDAGVGFQPRPELVREVKRRSDLSLCGVGADPCTGSP